MSYETLNKALDRIVALDAELAEARKDDLLVDATDAAKPSWWRGYDYGVAQICRAVNDILDGKEIYGVCGEPWEATRRRLAVMRGAK